MTLPGVIFLSLSGCRAQAAEAAGKAEAVAVTAAQLSRTAHTRAALAAAISASQAYNQVLTHALATVKSRIIYSASIVTSLLQPPGFPALNGWCALHVQLLQNPA
jgi:hypothetical protein